MTSQDATGLRTSSDQIIETLYAAFNSRDIDAALALMTDAIDWPKASEGGRVVGKAAIRDYWTRQWAAFNPRVEPIEITLEPDGRLSVQVHQVVRDLGGKLLMDDTVIHLFTLTSGQVERMDLQDSPDWHHASAHEPRT